MLRILHKAIQRLLVVSLLLLIVPVYRPAVTAQTHRPLSLIGDPDFNVSNLSPEMQVWYTRLWAAIRSEDIYPDPDKEASSGDLYFMGRPLNLYITALLSAFRATGDLALLDEVDRLMELARAQLADYNGDGYLNWRYLFGTESIYYGQDTHSMDEMLTHSFIPEVAYVLKSNEQFDPVYGEHAAFWTDYLEKHFLPKWEARGGLEKSLVHPYAHFMRFYYYLYKLTGNLPYLLEAERRATVLNAMMKTQDTSRGEGFVWDHRVIAMGHDALGCQPTVYAVLTVTAFQDLALQGFPPYADDSYMAHYAATFRDQVLIYGTDELAGDVCGGGEDRKREGFEKFLLGGIPGLAAWDDTGALMDVNEEAYDRYQSPDAPNIVFIPAYMLQVLAVRDQ